VEADETEYEAFEVLDQVVEDSESLRIPEEQDCKCYSLVIHITNSKTTEWGIACEYEREHNINAINTK